MMKNQKAEDVFLFVYYVKERKNRNGTFHLKRTFEVETIFLEVLRIEYNGQFYVISSTPNKCTSAFVELTCDIEIQHSFPRRTFLSHS